MRGTLPTLALLAVLHALALLALLLPTGTAVAATPTRVGGQFRYWSNTDHNDNRDYLAYWAPGPFHVLLEVWDFQRGADQFRPEVGMHLRDFRRSSYSVEWRHEHNDERLTLRSEQVLAKGFVGRASIAPIFSTDSTSVVWSVGGDYYWGSYHFASLDVIRDPRGNDLWAVPMRVRIATERNDWVQITFVPQSKRTNGWALDAKIRWLRLGFERNSRYDYTTQDNAIVTLGVEFERPPPR
ncbi:MAG TPA: hypothetical protein VN896_11385 [Methylomirabilota bacterium]|nr:hypothetical protein [Methylomirabilota bacterium]